MPAISPCFRCLLLLPAAFIGDSRAVLCRRGVAVPLTSDHKPGREDEMVSVMAPAACGPAGPLILLIVLQATSTGPELLPA